MALNIPDDRTKTRCEGYLSKFYGDALERTMNYSEFQNLNTSQLAWDRESKITYNWCKAYLRNHSGGSGKRQSKRKALKSKRKASKSRKVSKKY